MLWVRKGIVGLLSLILLISLIGIAFTTSLNAAFSKPAHITTWVNQSNFYATLTNLAVSDANKSVGNSVNGNLEGAIKQSFVSAYPETNFNQNVSTFINSNYSWLKGKSATPNFSINISQIKSDFAIKLATYFLSDLKTMPACTIAKEVALQNANPLTLTCNPQSINSTSIKNKIVSEINSSKIVVNESVLNAKNVLKRSNGKPYYTQTRITKVYKHFSVVPIILALIALICIVCIFFGSLRKIKALRKISGAFLIAGILLLLAKVGSSHASSHIVQHITKNATLSHFKTPTKNVVSQAVSYLGKIDMWFGLAYILIALLVVCVLLGRHKGVRIPKGRIGKAVELDDKDDSKDKAMTQEELSSRLNLSRSNIKTRDLPTAPPLKVKRAAKKPPRLIQ